MHIRHAHGDGSLIPFGGHKKPQKSRRSQKRGGSRFSEACPSPFDFQVFYRINVHAMYVTHPSIPSTHAMGSTTFNKSSLAAQKKPFPFITYWACRRQSEIRHMRVIPNGLSELNGPIMSNLIGGGEQLLREGDAISLHWSCYADSFLSGRRRMPLFYNAFR